MVIIDNYDKPFLDNIEKPEVAREIQEGLNNFYCVLKEANPYLKFVFLTGVSKFSMDSVFSGLNNLDDITISPKYTTICGYTQEEFESVFADRLSRVDLEKVNLWYNGYSWLGEPVYNPFEILLYLKEKNFKSYWSETGVPTFLIKILLERKYYLPVFEEFEVGEELFGSFDVDYISLETLVFQVGYLTIKEVETLLLHNRVYKLKYPNLEVKIAFNNHFLNYLLKDISSVTQKQIEIIKLLKQAKVEERGESFKSFFSIYSI